MDAARRAQEGGVNRAPACARGTGWGRRRWQCAQRTATSTARSVYFVILRHYLRADARHLTECMTQCGTLHAAADRSRSPLHVYTPRTAAGHHRRGSAAAAGGSSHSRASTRARPRRVRPQSRARVHARHQQGWATRCTRPHTQNSLNSTHPETRSSGAVRLYALRPYLCSGEGAQAAPNGPPHSFRFEKVTDLVPFYPCPSRKAGRVYVRFTVQATTRTGVASAPAYRAASFDLGATHQSVPRGRAARRNQGEGEHSCPSRCGPRWRGAHDQHATLALPSHRRTNAVTHTLDHQQPTPALPHHQPHGRHEARAALRSSPRPPRRLRALLLP